MHLDTPDFFSELDVPIKIDFRFFNQKDNNDEYVKEKKANSNDSDEENNSGDYNNNESEDIPWIKA